MWQLTSRQGLLTLISGRSLWGLQIGRNGKGATLNLLYKLIIPRCKISVAPLSSTENTNWSATLKNHGATVGVLGRSFGG